MPASIWSYQWFAALQAAVDFENELAAFEVDVVILNLVAHAGGDVVTLGEALPGALSQVPLKSYSRGFLERGR